MSSNSKGRMLLNEKTFRDLGSGFVVLKSEIMKKPTFKENVDSFVTQTSKIIRFPKDVIEYIKHSHSIMQVTVSVKIKNKLRKDSSN